MKKLLKLILIVVLILPYGITNYAQAAQSITVDNTKACGSGAVPLTCSFTTGGTNRMLVIIVNSTSRPNTATYGGDNMIRLSNFSPSETMFYLVNPKSGVNDIIVSGSSFLNDVTVISYNGVLQDPTYTGFSTGQNSGSSPLTTTLNVGTNNSLMVIAGGGSTAPSASTNVTSRVTGTNNIIGDSNSLVPSGNYSQTLTSASGMDLLVISLPAAPSPAPIPRFSLKQKILSIRAGHKFAVN